MGVRFRTSERRLCAESMDYNGSVSGGHECRNAAQK